MASNPVATPATTTDATMPAAPKKGGAKRGASQADLVDACAICLDPMAVGRDGLFVGPCGHKFHVQCAEASFVVGRKRNCPLCRAPFKHAPGFVALAKAEARQARDGGTHGAMGHDPTHTRTRQPTVMPDVALPVPDVTAIATAAVGSLEPDFATATVQTDVMWLRPGRMTEVSALVTVKFKDDDDDAPLIVPTDYVLLADISGSMGGSKMDSLRSSLLRMSDMFNPLDRVALVAFESDSTQLTPLAPLSDPDCHAAFRRAAMQLQARGGTDITAAMVAAEAILGARAARNPSAQILLMSDGQDYSARDAAMPTHGAMCTMGFGTDHDADLLSGLASRSVPRGTFTYVEKDDLIDEAIAGYVGDVSRVLTHSAKLVVAPLAPGVRVTGTINAPGAVTLIPDGGVTVDLGAARVDAKVSVLLTLQVTTPDQAAGVVSFQALQLTVEGTAIVGTGIVVTPPLTVSFDAKAEDAPPVSVAASDAIVEARNAARLVAASMAVAAMDTEEGARDVIAAARLTLAGTPAARAEAVTQLAALEANAAQLESNRRMALAGAHATAGQRGTMMSPHSGKGSRSMTYRMQCRKAAGPY
jgi:hypothetical protein